LLARSSAPWSKPSPKMPPSPCGTPIPRRAIAAKPGGSCSTKRSACFRPKPARRWRA